MILMYSISCNCRMALILSQECDYQLTLVILNQRYKRFSNMDKSDVHNFATILNYLPTKGYDSSAMRQNPISLDD
jgi:hypothetical protein